jgi:uncharacterized protein YyaL (SSP411 family)
MLLAALVLPALLAATPPTIAWEPWTDAAFARARREKRLVLVDVEAVWCHWCHVMDETTYRDPAVARLVAQHYVAVRVDQDARPDISLRYEDWGWPATVVLDGTGAELVKFQGYIQPARMASLLQGVVDDPTPGPSVTAVPPAGAAAVQPTLSPALRAELLRLLDERYDPEHGGWGFSHKYLQAEDVAWCLDAAARGDATAARRARETLDAERKLIDPAWGGAYQYSDSGDWDHPHFEKIASRQADDLETYALAYALWRDPRDLASAQAVHRYLTGFLRSPEGAFYTSQDADLVPGEHAGPYFALGDVERRKRGLPRVDTHAYARENGWMIGALAALHAVGGDATALDEAVRAADWVLAHRALPGGGFAHGERDAAGPYLGDTLAMGRALLALYNATADRRWLAHAEAAGAFIATTFPRLPGGVATAVGTPLAQRDENVQLARFANALFRATGDAAMRALAEHAMRFAAAREQAVRFGSGGLLLADAELGSEPLHVTVVGPRADAVTRALFAAAIALPPSYKRVELYDPAEGPLPHADTTFPPVRTPSAFLCTGGRCSSPSHTPAELQGRLARLGNGGAP